MYSIQDDEFDMIVDEEHVNTKDDVGDILHLKLDIYVQCNYYRKNMEIIHEMGGVYTILKNYKDEYGCARGSESMNEISPDALRTGGWWSAEGRGSSQL